MKTPKKRYSVDLHDDLNDHWVVVTDSDTLDGARAFARMWTVGTAVIKRVRIRDTQSSNKIIDHSICVPREALIGEDGVPHVDKIGNPTKLTFEWFEVH